MKRAENLAKLNEAAVALLRAGHLPNVGVNMALPLIEAAGASEAAYEEIMTPLSFALVERCDACLRLGGPSRGADDEVKLFEVVGRPVYRTLAGTDRNPAGEAGSLAGSERLREMR